MIFSHRLCLQRNYRYFLLFVFSGTALCLLVCATSLSRLVEISGDNDDEFDTALRREPIAIVLIIYTFGAVWFVGGLSIFHTYLVCLYKVASQIKGAATDVGAHKSDHLRTYQAKIWSTRQSLRQGNLQERV